MPLDAYLYTGLRSPFGRHAGALAKLRPDDMLAGVIAKVVAESGFAPEKIEDVVVGCANQAGEDSRCVARHAALVAGLPIEIPGSVLQRNCGSGLNAIAIAAQAITCGEGDVFVAGGVESMSRAPFVMGKAETPFSRDARVFDSTIGARFPNPKVEGRYGADTMPETADNLARDYQITREAADTFAAGSQSKYAAAKADGFFAGEIISVEVPGGRAGPVTVAEDEHPRPGTDMAALAKLRPLFKDGVTTAGNASGINDGAVAMIVASRKAGDAAGAQPIARILSSAVAGVEPRIMGFGPVPAAKKALERAGLDDQGHGYHRDQRGLRGAGTGVSARSRSPVRRQPGQPERRRDRDRPPARRLGSAHRADRGAAVAADGRPVRARRDVRRRRPRHRDRHRRAWSGTADRGTVIPRPDSLLSAR